MSFLKKLFGSKKIDDGPMPHRPLDLEFSINAANAANFARQYAAAVKKNDAVDLDFSVDSLMFIDTFLQKFKDEGLTVDQFAETIFVAGCYVGETIRLNSGSLWMNREEIDLPVNKYMSNIVVRSANGSICDPIAKTYKRFYYGETDSVLFLYHVFAREAAK